MPVTTFAASSHHDTAENVQTLLHILDYISVDYPGTVKDGVITDKEEYREQIEFSRSLNDLLDKLPAHSLMRKLRQQVDSLQHAILGKGPASLITADCRAISQVLLKAYQVPVTPLSLPSFDEGKTLYQQECVSCHGVEGKGDGVMANHLQPRPANFHDTERQSHRSLYSLYSTITLGVNNTAMQSYSLLSDQQRWALAFYVSHFFATDAQIQQGRQEWEAGHHPSGIRSLKELALTTPRQAMSKGGEAALAELLYLRRHPENLTATPTQALEISQKKMADSLHYYQKGDIEKSYQSATSAYLDGFELTEGALKSVAPKLRKHIEVAMADYRNAIKKNVPVETITAQYNAIIRQLEAASDRLRSDESVTVVLVGAILILLREGLEAILVLASIAGLLAKANRSHHMSYIHVGWITAILLGLGIWYAAHSMIDISGVRRELTEGVAALVAAGMLLYVGFWLHNKSNAHQWRQFIHGSLEKQVGKKVLWGLAFIAFIAVFREVLETALFYETFWLQSTLKGQQFIILGFVLAATMLIAISWMIFRLSLKLPLRQFFIVNAMILFVLSIVYSGKGLAALQEGGLLSSTPVHFIEIDLLGIYPTLETLLTQMVILTGTIGWIWYQKQHEGHKITGHKAA